MPVVGGSEAHFKGLFDLECELAGSLNKACSDSPRHVFGFMDAYSPFAYRSLEIPVAVVAGESNRGGNVLIDIVDDQLCRAEAEQGHFMVLSDR